ncbi:MAG: HAMP domain-containing sensor histidine kinase [Ruminococcus sp.]|nr:HAMP domain-containing histidine kinase [Ruminococcus sp.]MDD7669850.1 HAMP domain-containing sensor histidine kinase [Ruminococcus sp.]
MKKRDPIFIIGATIVGIALAATVMMSLSLIPYISKDTRLVASALIAAATVSLLCVYYSTPRFQPLRNYYLYAALISLAAVFVIALIYTLAFYGLIDDIIQNSGTLVRILVLYSWLCVSLLLFLLIFSLITRPKASYIRYLTKEVQKIAETDTDAYLVIKGNDELSELGKSINKMAYDIRESKRRQQTLQAQKNELITNVSHDLRSPLTSIIGYVRLLRENGYDDKEKFDRYVEVIDRRLDGLNGMINELFDLTRLSSPGFTLTSCRGDITELVRQFASEMPPLLEESRLTLISDIENTPFVSDADFEKLARVMYNLFTNVIKYASPDSEVILKSRTEDGKRIIISLTNTLRDGAGISTENMFERFYRDDKARSDPQSSGLGLAIAKRIVELHDGAIKAESSGSAVTVTVTLPRIYLQSCNLPLTGENLL